jgi:hypothetical protein
VLPIELKAALKDTKAYSLLTWWRSRRDLAKWEQSGRPDPPPPAIKHAMLGEYGRRFGLRTLVETGTYHGDAIQANLDCFSRIYSIELSNELHRAAVRRFKRYHKVTLLQGDSAELLPPLALDVKEPALFWLDGHYSGGITARGARDTPVVPELEAVLIRPFKDVVLIDDLRMFDGRDGYPTLSELKALIRTRRPDYALTIENDIARVVPGG